MEFSQLANLGDLLGGLGVIGSLIYVAFEIRSNTQAAHNTAYHETVNQILAGNRNLMSDRWNSLNARPQEELSEAELYQLEAPIAEILFGMENLLHLRQRGHLDQKMWENVEKNFYPMLRMEMFYSTLKGRPGPLSQDLLSEIDSVLKRDQIN